MSTDIIKCGNGDCSETGKLKCSACGLVSYCGQNCQKAHWNDHKTFCKANRKVITPSAVAVANSGNSSPSRQAIYPQPGQIIIDPAIAVPLKLAKEKTQDSFLKGDYKLSNNHLPYNKY